MLKKIPANTKYFHFYNANPKGKRASDCVVRAISKATEVSSCGRNDGCLPKQPSKDWDSVLDDLIAFSHKYKVMPNEKACYGKYLESIGFSKENQPKYEDLNGMITKYTGEEFCDFLNRKSKATGVVYNVVAHIGTHHIVAIIFDEEEQTYKVFDTWNSSKKIIGNYWIKERR